MLTVKQREISFFVGSEMQYGELIWFDRGFESSGRAIRNDVREAARNKWPQLCAFARRRLGDRELEIQELFESAVIKVSRYLDQKQSPPQDPSGLLVVKFRQELNFLAQRLKKTESKGAAQDIEPFLEATEWGEQADRQIFLEELLRRISKENRTVLRLRGIGYEWSEIAKMLHKSSSVIRANFWRDVRRVQADFNQFVQGEEE